MLLKSKKSISKLYSFFNLNLRVKSLGGGGGVAAYNTEITVHTGCHFLLLYLQLPSVAGYVLPRWPSGKASASRAEGPGFESRLRRDFFGVESYQ